MNYEVETRGLFKSKTDYTSLLAFMKENAEYKNAMKRFQMVFVENKDFSADPDADVDLRLRVQNGKCLVVLKHGNWHSGATRKEYEIEIKPEDIEEQLNIFLLLNKGWGVSLYTETEFFDYKNTEVAIVHLYDDIYYWELEVSTNNKTQIKDLEKENARLATKLGLKTMTSQSMQNYVAKLTERPFWRFHFENQPPSRWLAEHQKFIDLALEYYSQ